MTRAAMLDVSFWNSKIDFSKMKAAGIPACYAKASQLAADSRFKEYWPAMKQAGLLRGAYHYLDWRESELIQAKRFMDTMGGDWGELPPVADFEMIPAPADAQGRLWNFLQYVEKATGKVPMIYSGYYYWKSYGTPNSGWLKYPFWLAWYAAEWYIKLKTLGGTGAPPPWKNWTFWQYDGNGNGPLYGSQGLSMDMNYFQGTIDDLYKWANLAPNEPPQPPTPLYPAYKSIYALNVRKGPLVTSSALGVLPANTTVYIDTVDAGGYSHFQPFSMFPAGGWLFSSYLTRV